MSAAAGARGELRLEFGIDAYLGLAGAEPCARDASCEGGDLRREPVIRRIGDARRPAHSGGATDRRRLSPITRARERNAMSPPMGDSGDAQAGSGDVVFSALTKFRAEAGDLPDVFVAPGIPRTKLSNAMQACGVPASERVLALIDCTVFGSATSALLFSSDALYYHHDTKAMQVGPGRMAYTDLGRIRSVRGRDNAFIRLDEEVTIVLVGSNLPIEKAVALVTAVRDAVRHTAPPGPPAPESPAEQTTAAAPAQDCATDAAATPDPVVVDSALVADLIEGRAFRMPPECSVCSLAADGSVAQEHSEHEATWIVTRSLRVPLCRACRARYVKSKILGAVLMAIGLACELALILAIRPDGALTHLLVYGGGTLVLILPGYYFWWKVNPVEAWVDGVPKFRSRTYRSRFLRLNGLRPGFFASSGRRRAR